LSTGTAGKLARYHSNDGRPLLGVILIGAKPWPAGAVSRFGEADRERIASDARRGGLDAAAGSGTIGAKEDADLDK
jgi:hypothetical protein